MSLFAERRVEAFNLFNRANALGHNGVYGNGARPIASFGSPLAGLSNAEPARMVQVLRHIVLRGANGIAPANSRG